MQTELTCLPCLLRQAVDVVSRATDDPGLRARVVRDVLGAMQEEDFARPPPSLAGHIHHLVAEATGVPDPYARDKERLSRSALDVYALLKVFVRQAPDALELAVRLAIAGNSLDFGVKDDYATYDLHHAIGEALAADMGPASAAALAAAARGARTILYLADNAGELVFDRLLLDELPCEKVTLAVKARPVVDDATREDALAAGLGEVVPIIDNGTAFPGTLLDRCSDAFRARFEAADLVISKGQANFETLHGSRERIFFLFRAKCAVVSRLTGIEEGSFVLLDGRLDRP